MRLELTRANAHYPLNFRLFGFMLVFCYKYTFIVIAINTTLVK